MAFYEKVLDFRKVLEQEDAGAPYEALTGVFALRTRTARARGTRIRAGSLPACRDRRRGHDEQAHLNGVEGAHLRITTLRAARGPGVELLQYLAPPDGRPCPADARPNDIVHWQTTVLVHDLDDEASAVQTAGATAVSRAAAELSGSRLGLSRAVLVRDPDGHALLLAEPRPVLARPGSQ